MGFETIRVEEAGGVATLTLNRQEKLNALNVLMGEEICSTLDVLAGSASARVLVVTGAGRMFSAGGDLSSMDQVAGDAASIDHSVRIYCEVARRLRELPLPVVAKINGDAFGGALGIMMACDFRLARDDARLGFVFTRVGLSGADAGVSYLLPRLVGVAKAVELLFLGETIAAPEAERLGLIHRAVPMADLDRVTDEIVTRLAAGPPLALRFTKRAVYDGLTRDMAADFEYEAYVQALCFQSEDHREGLRAFRDKRAPVFRGR
ncbi:MAG: enoyl-CoA hydratase/isomerase family protein [Candidatus Rokubacteria bacterium]|nr:enoyl-CoA hydratase/isomerase family protein [Candidatus Rokubacteria bacterium]